MYKPGTQFSSVQFLSHVQLFVTHGLQHARPPCPSPTSRVYLNSCTLSPWYHLDGIIHLILCHPLLLLPSIFPSIRVFSTEHQVAKVLEYQLQYQSCQWIFRTHFLLDGLIGSPCSPSNYQESLPKPQFKSINSSVLSFLILQVSYPYMTTGKTIALTRWTFVGKVMSLLFNMLSTWS